MIFEKNPEEHYFIWIIPTTVFVREKFNSFPLDHSISVISFIHFSIVYKIKLCIHISTRNRLTMTSIMFIILPKHSLVLLETIMNTIFILY